MPDAGPPSEHLDEFRRRTSRLRREQGDLAALWAVADDLGAQVSEVRHDISNVKQSYEKLDLDLFGNKPRRIPGAFDLVRSEIADVKQTLIEQTTAGRERTAEAQRDLHQQAVAREQWWANWWVRSGILIGAVGVVLDVVHTFAR